MRIPAEARQLERVAGTDAPLLDCRQRLNVGLATFLSQAAQVLIVSVALGALRRLRPAGRQRRGAQGLAGNPVDVLVEFELFGERLELTSERLRVAAGPPRPVFFFAS